MIVLLLCVKLQVTFGQLQSICCTQKMFGATLELSGGICWHSVSYSTILAGKAIAVATAVFAGMTSRGHHCNLLIQ